MWKVRQRSRFLPENRVLVRDRAQIYSNKEVEHKNVLVEVLHIFVAGAAAPLCVLP